MDVHEKNFSSNQGLSQLYSDVIEMRGEMVCKFDADTRLLQVNEAYAKAFGKSVQELLGTRFIDLVPEEDRESIFRHLADLKIKKHEVMYEHQVIDQHQNKVWQEWCDRAIFNDDGSLSHFISVGRGIEQRKQLEKQLMRKHEAESLIASVAKNLVNAELNELNASINQALGEIGVYVNAGRVYVHQYDFEQHLLSNTHEWCAEGVEPSQAQLQNIPLDLVQEWLEKHKRGERVFIPDTRSMDIEKNLRSQMQRRGIKSTLMLPLIKNGSCLGCLGVDILNEYGNWSTSVFTIIEVLAEVITNAIDRREYEAKLIQAREAAEQAVKEKSNFLATMSHEIRNPLNGVLGMIEMLEITNLDKQQQHMLRALSSSGTMLLEIVNQVSELQKVERNRQELRYSDIGIEELIGDIKIFFEERIKQKNLFFKVENRTGSVGDHFRGAYLPLKQVLVNLIGNAIKFTDEGGISIVVEQVSSGRESLQTLRFSISDTGPGIASEDAARLFRPYVQLSSVKITEKEGFGLGLSISKQLVQRMGGEIGVDTREDNLRGARFWFEIPTEPPVIKQDKRTDSKETSASTEETTAPEAPHESAMLLAAKPDAGIHVLRRQLEVAGTDYAFCSSPAEVKDYFARPEASFKHLIIDLNLGRSSVLSTISKLKNKSAWWNLNIILLAGSRKEFKQSWKNEYDIQEMLTKPLSNQQIYRLLEQDGVDEMHPAGLDQAMEAAAPARKESSSYSGLRVLVAEDNQVNQMLIKFILDKLGLKEFKIVPNGARAIEEIQTHEPAYDLVLMDCQMPVMDGFEASRHIRKLDDPLKAATPIVAVTAFATQEYNKRCLAAGMDKYITKPYALSNIRELIDEVLEDEGFRDKTSASQAEDENQPAAAVPVIDTALLNERFGEDKALINTMLEQFLSDGTQQIAQLRSFADAGDWPSFYNVNHQIKGAAATMSATAIFQRSERLEVLAETLKQRPATSTEKQSVSSAIDELDELFQRARDITTEHKQD